MPKFAPHAGLGRAGGLLLLAAGSLTVGCAEPEGFLDASTVNAISKQTGDEVGTQRSGTYALQIEDRDCGCDLEPGLDGLSICSWVDLLGTISGEPGIAAVIVEATDGIVVMRLLGAPNAILVGPMEDGGGVSAGAVTTLQTFIAEGALVTRIDGDFDPSGDGYVFEGELAHRISGKASIEDDKPDVDCEERLSVIGLLADQFFP